MTEIRQTSHLCNLGTSILSSPYQWCPTVIISCINIRTSRQQNLHRRGIQMLGKKYNKLRVNFSLNIVKKRIVLSLRQEQIRILTSATREHSFPAAHINGVQALVSVVPTSAPADRRIFPKRAQQMLGSEYNNLKMISTQNIVKTRAML